MSNTTAAHHQAPPSGTHVKQFENLKTLLKNAKSTQGNDLFTHLQEVFKRLIMHYPDQALDKLEEVSYLLKAHQQQKLNITDYINLEEIHNYGGDNIEYTQYLEKLLAYFKKPAVEGEEEGAEAEAAVDLAPIGYVPDLLADVKLFEWAGIGFGEIETYRIHKALKKLAIETQAGNIRFFGKISGSERDYYVAEGTLEGGDEGAEEGQEKPADFEPRGTGVNKFVYWVTNDIMDKWTKLPDLLPSDIRAARQIKVSLSGDLERKIFTNPFFFGTEKVYLRVQIARITHSTTIAPKLLYKVQEENPRDIEDVVPDSGPVVMPTTHQMSLMSNWVHYNPSILLNGRHTLIDPEGADEEETERLKKLQEAEDPYEPRLKILDADREVQVGGAGTSQKAWVVKHMGDKNVYNNHLNPNQQVNFGVVVVRSLQWPGAFTFYNQGRYVSIYVGTGLKYETEVSYYPVHPPKIMEDPEEFPEQEEPTPKFEEQPPAQELGEGEGAQEEEAPEEEQ